MRILITVLILIIAYLQSQIWFGSGSFIELYQLQKAIESQRQDVEHFRDRNQELSAEILDLKSGLDAIEERARSELGMIKTGEVFYLIHSPEE